MIVCVILVGCKHYYNDNLNFYVEALAKANEVASRAYKAVCLAQESLEQANNERRRLENLQFLNAQDKKFVDEKILASRIRREEVDRIFPAGAPGYRCQCCSCLGRDCVCHSCRM